MAWSALAMLKHSCLPLFAQFSLFHKHHAKQESASCGTSPASEFLRLDLAERSHPQMYRRKPCSDTVGKSNEAPLWMTSHPSSFLDRLRELLEIAALPVQSKQVKLEAWFVKGCCVLIKKKLSRGQWPKARNFRLLMAAALGSDDTHDDDPEPEGEPEACERTFW